MRWMQHFITNLDVELAGDAAKVTARYNSAMQLPGVDGPSFAGGYCHHALVRSAQGWRSRRVTEERLWSTNPPPH